MLQRVCAPMQVDNMELALEWEETQRPTWPPPPTPPTPPRQHRNRNVCPVPTCRVPGGGTSHDTGANAPNTCPPESLTTITVAPALRVLA